jgi:hypothetical protein
MSMTTPAVPTAKWLILCFIVFSNRLGFESSGRFAATSDALPPEACPISYIMISRAAIPVRELAHKHIFLFHE